MKFNLQQIEAGVRHAVKSKQAKQWAKAAVIAGAMSATAVFAQTSGGVDASAAANQAKTDISGALAVIGGVMLTVSGIAVAWKWAKAAFFG
ncbi:hypothetical protein RN01_16685 [Cupriavidus sp. SHE]|uniref:hypothetical protein n=1 Tax=Cupriavidus TaxID=106589 RepID=UPI0004B3D724|nr:hypothetical protein [Cupriavidus sp. SHE]KWR81181.1 hypothetical protein RN01_16685 [Cupriavidus sp. SHE]